MSDEIKHSGLVFWAVYGLLFVSSLFYLGIWGYQNANIRAVSIVSIFGFIVLASVVIIYGFYDAFINRRNSLGVNISLSASCFWQTIGLVLWIGVLSIIKLIKTGSILSVFSAFNLPQNQMFSTIASELPLFAKVYLNTFLVPFGEELFWLIALPLIIYWSAKAVHIENKLVIFGIMLFVSSITFALFHVGYYSNKGLIYWLFTGFGLSAVIFRSFLIGMYWGDIMFNTFPLGNVLPAFALGVHMGNNIVNYGIINYLLVMTQNPFGWVILGLHIITFFIAFKYITSLIKPDNNLPVNA